MLLAKSVLLGLFVQCSPDVAPETLSALIDVESSRNPYAIAVVYDKTTKEEDKLHFAQPQNEDEAMAIIAALETQPQTHKSYSVGVMQVNSSNFGKYGINKSNLFNACKNIEAGAEIFKACYAQAKKNTPNGDEQVLLRNAASCYYSGNEIRGYKTEKNGTSYVDRINRSVAKNYKVPAIKPLNGDEALAQSQQETETGQVPLSEKKEPLKTHEWDVFGDFKY